MSEERTARMSSVLGETGVVIGNVDGVGDLEIRGRVQGSVSLSGRVLIAETGVVIGNVEATHIAVAGEVRGDLRAKDGVEVQAQGRVEGNVEAPRVGIEAGARVRGMLRTGGELPSTKNSPAAEAETTAKDNDSAKPPEASPAPQREDVVETAKAPNHLRKERAEERRETGAPPRRRNDFTPSPVDRSRKLKPGRSAEDVRRADEKPQKVPQKKGAPPPPTFVKGARGRAK